MIANLYDDFLRCFQLSIIYHINNAHFISVPDGQFMFARLPPDPPCDCQVVSTSAYSVRLAWAPAFSTDNEVSYNIRYKLK